MSRGKIRFAALISAIFVLSLIHIFGEDISDESHSKEFADDYFNSAYDVSKCFAEYPKSTIKFGKNEDEHAGEQFYTCLLYTSFLEPRQAPFYYIIYFKSMQVPFFQNGIYYF